MLPLRPSALFLLAVLALGVGESEGQGQGHETHPLEQALTEARQRYEDQWKRMVTSAQRLYLERLLRLESEASLAENYESAKVYATEAARVRDTLEEAAEAPLSVTLFPFEASLAGGVSLSLLPAVETLAGWQSAESSASWKILSLPAGGYQIKILHSGNGGVVPVSLSGTRYHVVGELHPTDDGGLAESLLGDLRVLGDPPVLTLSLAEGTSETSHADVRIHQVLLQSHAP